MNARYLVAMAVVVALIGVAIKSRSTLTPERGVDHVLYGSLSDFMAQEAAVGDFNGDGNDDIVTTIMWDDPTTCDAELEDPVNGCGITGWTSWTATKAGQTNKIICRFPTGPAQTAQYNYWTSCGWTLTPGACATCVYAHPELEDKGAAYIFDGGDWSGKAHDINVAAGSAADHMVVGNAGKDKIYNGVAAGDVTVDACGCDELVLGAPQETSGGVDYGPGEVYVIGGTRPWPAMSTKITPPNDDRVDHYFVGRDLNDGFGKGVAVGDLDGDGDAEVVVAAPLGDGPNNSLTNSGEIYIFHSNSFLPDVVDLYAKPDTAFYSANNGSLRRYAQIIFGGAAYDSTGVTLLRERHEVHASGRGPGNGNYEPVGLAIGNWNGDDYNDLAIGAGSANGGDGQIFIIYGGGVNDPTRKLRPGNPIRLYRRLGQSDAVDVKIMGKDGSRLGAGIMFADLDNEGLSSEGNGKDDLVMGAPYAEPGTQIPGIDPWRYYGEVYIAWGSDPAPSDSMEVSNSDHIKVTIRGHHEDDQIGGHFAGNQDIDGDGMNDLGIAGQDVSFALFGREDQNAWPSTIDLETDSADPDLRVLKWTSYPTPNSMTIEFMDLDNDGKGDLIFGGYDKEGMDLADHAGQMWVMSMLWKRGTITSNQTWSGNVFVDGDIIVDNDATLTIEPGAEIWLWPDDIGGNLGVDAALVEIRVEDGALNVGSAEGDSVRFMSWDPEHTHTNANDKWFGIWVDDGCAATIHHATIRNALRGIQARSSITVKNSRIEDCKYVGITIAGDSTNADSVFVENTTIRRIGRTSGGIGINALGKKAAILLKNCDVDSCEIGIACYTKAKLYTDGTDVSNMTTYGVKVFGRANAVLLNSTVESNGLSALRVADGATVEATGCNFRTSDYGAELNNHGGALAIGSFTNCTFALNDVGLRVESGAEATVGGCTFTDNDDGIYTLGGTLQVEGGTNDSDYNGIILDGSSGLIAYAVVGTNDGGIAIKITDASDMGLSHSRIWDNSTGVWVEEASTAILDNCGSTCPSQNCTEGNSFIGNVRHVRNLNSSGTIDAECNYWTDPLPGEPLPDGGFVGSVDRTPYLTADPTDDLMTVSLPSKLPKAFRLAQNYPNPFNPVTTIAYDVPAPGGNVQIRIYNVSGQLVRTLVNGFSAAGQHEATWEGISENSNPVASGVYFVSMVAPDFQATRKLVLLK